MIPVFRFFGEFLFNYTDNVFLVFIGNGIENFKNFGLVVVVLSFIVFPFLLCFIGWNFSSVSPGYLVGVSFTMYLTNIILWVKLFKELD